MKARPKPFGGTRPDTPHVDRGSDDRLLLTVPEAASLLDIGSTLAYEKIGRGELPHIRIGRAVRVPRRALEAWIAANTRGAMPEDDARHPRPGQ